MTDIFDVIKQGIGAMTDPRIWNEARRKTIMSIEQNERNELRQKMHEYLAMAPDPKIRAYAAHLGCKLDDLVEDPEPEVRVAVACYGRDDDLEFLRHDEAPEVRLAVALNGYYAEMLDDPSPEVRAAAYWAMENAPVFKTKAERDRRVKEKIIGDR
mgnify:CR=1 FL=1